MEEMNKDRIQFLMDQELMWHLNRAIMFHEAEDGYNARRWVERSLGIIYAAGALDLITAVEGWNIISMLLKSGLRKEFKEDE